MSLARLLNVIILILFAIGAILLLMLEITTVRQSILDQMSANLETAITALGLVLQGTLLNDDKVLAETIVNAMFDGGFVTEVDRWRGVATQAHCQGTAGVGLKAREQRRTDGPGGADDEGAVTVGE